MLKNRKYSWIILLLSASLLKAQDRARLSLEELLSTVETSYPEVTKYDPIVKSYESRSEGATAWMPPVFSMGIDRFPYSFKELNAMSPMNQAGLMFSFEQMIPNSSRLNAKKDYYLSLKDIKLSQQEWTKNQLRALARMLYYQRYVNDEKLEILQKSQEVLQLLVSTAEGKYAYNQAELSSIYKARARLEELKNMQLMVESMTAESNIGINTLLNRDLTIDFAVDTIIRLQDYEPSLQDTTFLNRSDIAAMKNNIRSMELDKRYMSLSGKPDFGIRAEHMQMFGMQEQFSVMGMITIPLVPWSSKMYKSDVKAMDLEILAMQKEIESMRLMASRMAAEKLVMLNYKKEQLKNYEAVIIPAFRKSFETSMLAYQQNTQSFFVLLDAWEMLLMKQMEELNVLLEALKLEAEYEFEIQK